MDACSTMREGFVKTHKAVYGQCMYLGCNGNATHDRWTSSGSEVSYCWKHWMHARVRFGDHQEKPVSVELFDEL
jgi:hypothetical protein